MCNVDKNAVASDPDLEHVYELPLVFAKEGLDKKIVVNAKGEPLEVIIPYGQFVDWVFLLNRNGQVTTGNFQSLKWGNKANDPDGKTFIGMAPYYAHTITADGRSCGDCHNNAAVQDWAADGVIDVVTWDAMAGSLNHMTGVIPVPPDYLEGLRFDFVDQATPAQGGPGGPWQFLEAGPDSIHILYGEPLTESQMDDLQ